MRFLIKKHFRKTDKKPTKKPTKTDKNRQKPINFFGPSARPTKTDSEKGLSVYNPGFKGTLVLFLVETFYTLVFLVLLSLGVIFLTLGSSSSHNNLWF